MITKYCKVIFHTTTTDQTRDECPENSVIVDISLKARTLYFTPVFRQCVGIQTSEFRGSHQLTET